MSTTTGTEHNSRRRVDPEAVDRLARRMGIGRQRARNQLSEPREVFLEKARLRRAEAWGLHQQGFSYSQIATSMGISPAAAAGLVQRAARERGVTVVPVSRARRVA